MFESVGEFIADFVTSNLFKSVRPRVKRVRDKIRTQLGRGVEIGYFPNDLFAMGIPDEIVLYEETTIRRRFGLIPVKGRHFLLRVPVFNPAEFEVLDPSVKELVEEEFLQ